MQKLLHTHELCKRRASQLQLEEIMDLHLRVNYVKCPKLIFEFIMAMKKTNRKYSSEIYNASILEYAEKVEKSLDIVDKLYSQYDFKTPKNTCENIAKILQKI